MFTGYYVWNYKTDSFQLIGVSREDDLWGNEMKMSIEGRWAAIIRSHQAMFTENKWPYVVRNEECNFAAEVKEPE